MADGAGLSRPGAAGACTHAAASNTPLSSTAVVTRGIVVSSDYDTSSKELR
jgi:hypothetical protein